MYQSSPSTWTSSQTLAPFRLEITFLNSINKALRDRSCTYRAFHWVLSLMTFSRFLLNVCFCRGNLSRWFVIMCWLAVSLHLRLLIVSHWVYNLMQTDAIPYSLFGFVACISREKNYFVHNHKLTKIFENSKVITRWSAVTRSELGNKMCMLTRSIQARKDKNVYPSLQIVRPPSQRTLLSKFVIWFMTCSLHHWSHKYYVITFFQNLLYLKVWASYIWRGIGQRTHCFAAVIWCQLFLSMTVCSQCFST